MAPTNIFVPGVPSIGKNRRRLILPSGPSALTLPSGAIGLYLSSDYASATNSIKNRIAGTTPNNLMPFPSRKFGSSPGYVNTATTTDANAVDPLGGNDATSITTASASTWGNTTNPASVTLPAGTYTVGIWVRWKNTGGTSAAFWFGPSTNTGSGTATTSWQRFSKTFTSDGVTPFTMYAIRNPNAATQADFEIFNLGLYPGPSDLYLSDPNIDGHMTFGGGVGQTKPATGTGTVRFGGTLGGSVVFPTAQAFTDFTVIYLSQTNGSPSAASFDSIFSWPLSNGDSSLAIGLRTLTSQFGLMYQNTLSTVAQATGEIYDPGNSLGSVAISYSPTGGTGKLYSNGLLAGSGGATHSVQTLKEIRIGSQRNSGTERFSNYELAAWAIFPRILSDAEVLQAHRYLKAQVLLSGATVPDSRVLIYEGDSITFGTGAGNTQGYPYLAASQLTRGERGPNYGVFGSKFSDLNARIAAVTAMCDLAVAAGRTPIVHVGIGSNDFALTVSAATLYSQVKGYAAACRAHGAKVIVASVLSRHDANDALRNAYNPMVAAGVGTDFDGFTDFGQNALVGADGAWSNATYFNSGDQTHPTSAGYALMAPIAAAAINALP